MKAAVIYDPGEATNLKLEERPVPVPGPDEVLIRVRAFGLNRSELMTRKGFSPSVRFPRVLGIECAGQVESDPAGTFAPGQQVFAFMGEMGRDYDGSYAEYTCVPRHIVVPFESSLPWETLGAIPELFQTAHGSLYPALEIRPGETLLIRGGTSSVGLLAAQIAREAGLTVVSTTRNPDRTELLRTNGVSAVIIDDGAIAGKLREQFPNGVDKVLELVGTPTLQDSLRCLRPGGTACMTGMLSEQWDIKNFAPMEFIPPTVKLTVYDSGSVRSPASAFRDFVGQVEEGKINLPIGRVMALEEIVEAHQLMESNRANGKIVVVP